MQAAQPPPGRRAYARRRAAAAGRGAASRPAGSGLGYVQHELLQELAHEAEGPAEAAASAQLEGSLLQLVACSGRFLALYASGPLLSAITVAELDACSFAEVRRQPSCSPALLARLVLLPLHT